MYRNLGGRERKCEKEKMREAKGVRGGRASFNYVHNEGMEIHTEIPTELAHCSRSGIEFRDDNVKHTTQTTFPTTKTRNSNDTEPSVRSPSLRRHEAGRAGALGAGTAPPPPPAAGRP